jgi:hypothetical protein
VSVAVFVFELEEVVAAKLSRPANRAMVMNTNSDQHGKLRLARRGSVKFFLRNWPRDSSWDFFNGRSRSGVSMLSAWR